jgi:hypothetical protein
MIVVLFVYSDCYTVTKSSSVTEVTEKVNFVMIHLEFLLNLHNLDGVDVL